MQCHVIPSKEGGGASPMQLVMTVTDCMISSAGLAIYGFPVFCGVLVGAFHAASTDLADPDVRKGIVARGVASFACCNARLHMADFADLASVRKATSITTDCRQAKEGNKDLAHMPLISGTDIICR